jgi:hypothetical protein
VCARRLARRKHPAEQRELAGVSSTDRKLALEHVGGLQGAVFGEGEKGSLRVTPWASFEITL